MKKLLIFLGFIVLFLVGSHHWTCRVLGLPGGICGEEAMVETDSNVEPVAEVVKPLAQFNIAGVDGTSLFNFKGVPTIKKGIIDVGWPDWKVACFDSLYMYLNREPSALIKLKGNFNPQLMHAENISDSTMAFNRMLGVKEALVKYGVNPDRIKIDLVAKENLFNQSESEVNGLSIGIGEISKEIQEVIDQGVANKTLYCEFGKKQFNPDRTLRAYQIELKNYLNKYPERKVVITGHTDDLGEDEANEQLGLDRAKNVRDYLRYEGIKLDKMEIRSKGEKEPVADNSTPEGRAKNRRIQVEVR